MTNSPFKSTDVKSSDPAPPPPTKGGLRFTLRSLMLVVLLAACVLGYEVNAVRQRKVGLQRLKQNPAAYVVTVDEHNSRIAMGIPVARSNVQPLWHRRMMGDQSVHEVVFFKNTGNYNPSDKSYAQWLFPEATLKEEERLFEPCHPGCFPDGTPVETPTGPCPIEAIAAGDKVLSIRLDGTVEELAVQSLFKTENRLWEIETSNGNLVTTETQPLRLADGSTRGAGELQAGDILLKFSAGQVQQVSVRAVTKTERIARVNNLVLGDKQSFVAGGFVVRSKPPPENIHAEHTH